MLNDSQISSVSYAYPVVPGDVRAGLVTALGTVEAALARSADAGIPAFVLSTCLRIEIAVPAPMDRLDEALSLIFRETPAVDGSVRRSGTDAVEHLFRIVSGLESPVVGEREILVQFRQATAAAGKHGMANGAFRSLFDAAIATARSVRSELPTDPRRSMASIAAGLTAPADRVGVLGHGSMGRSVAEALLALPHRPVVEVFVRRPEAIEMEGVIVRSLGEAPSALVTLPAVISATSAKTRLIPAVELARIFADRTEPLTLIDMAMPPDFSPTEETAVRYYDIDDLAGLSRDRNSRGRADRMVAESAAEFAHKIWASKHTGSLIEHLFDQADDAVAEVVERLAGKLTSPQDRALLEQAAHTATRKILHRPVHYLSGDGAKEAATVAAAFGIDLDD
ncbi:MAG: hypothetical protein QGD89_02040 [Actinomycetota bacterium]|nr:hypothetical protein [Actinomycetota bacterium]